MKRILLVGLLVGIALAVIGAEPVKVIMATTDDGRRVILMPDGKWNFVEGVPQPKKEAELKEASCKDQIWKDIVAYFYNWDISQSEKASFLLKTDWNRIEFGPSLAPRTYRVKVSVLVNDDCSLKVDTYYQLAENTNAPLTKEVVFAGWKDQTLGDLEKIASKKGLAVLQEPGPIISQKVLDYDAKMKSDLNAFAAKYKSQPSPQP